MIEKENEEEAKKNGDELKYYGRDILNNSGVNLVTGIITSIISGIITTKIIWWNIKNILNINNKFNI